AWHNEKMVMGESVFKFEEEFARYIGVKHAISTSSGTMALFLSLIGSTLNKGSRVLSTPFTFIATTNSIIHASMEPVFADINLRDYLLDPEMSESVLKSKEVKGIMPVHLYGRPVDMDAFIDLKEKYGLVLVEDCAQSHGAEWRGKKLGSIGDFGAFSFYSAKNMTVGGDGGMVTTNDEDAAEKIKSIRDCGRKDKYTHIYLGYTARLNTANAAIGRVQLRRLDKWNERRRQIADLYRGLLKDVEEIVLPPEDTYGKSVYHLFVIRTKNRERDKLKEFLNDNGIEVGIHYPLANHVQPIYKELFGFEGGEYPNSEIAAANVLSLPMYPGLTDGEVKTVAEKIKEFYGR
ncbi:MAG: DegT/DnrJ/EryC1/StrS family aminotransferase, partial [Euryarchaeota archaeon]|nr:DegT/DnrJ/EryC1/StrS family aminotransferase [Euryarchaeota archaeon]